MKLISKATILVIAAMIAGFLVPSAAHADSYSDYDVTGIFQSGNTLSGFFVIDNTTGVISDAQLTADTESFSCPDGAAYPNGCILGSLSGDVGFVSAPGAPTSYSELELNWASTSPLAGFTLDAAGSYCANCWNAGFDMLVSGSATMFGTDAAPLINQNNPVSTPEPTSGLLLTLGLIGLGFAGLKQRNAINHA